MTGETLPFIDCHHHIWDPAGDSHPWLAPDAAIPFRYGDYSSIKGPYLPRDYDHDASGYPVVGHVTMEGEWNPADPVAETRWLAGVFAQHPTYLGHVARAFLDRADVDAVLAGHAAFPFVKAIRHKPTAAPSPDKIVPGAAGGLSDPAWRRGYAMLASHGLHFELQAPWWHARELVDLIDRFPDTPVVINHMFLPADRSDAALAGWREALRLVARAPQVSLKVSGIGLAGRPWTLADQRQIVLDAIEIMGADRCMAASNFPVDRLTGSFETIIGGYHVATLGLGRAERAALFHDTAVRVYRLPIAPISAATSGTATP